MSRLLLLAPLLLLSAACHTPPEEACNRVRFGWLLPQLDPSSDASEAEGIQIDFDVRSDLEAGIRSTLFQRLEGSEEQVFLSETKSDSDGLLSFRNVSLPEGEVVLILEARDECGLHRTGRRTFVWDGLGYPECELSLATSPDMPTDGSIPVLNSAHDEDANTAGMQVRVIVETGRPDMEVTLFARDRERDEDQEFIVPSDSSGIAEIPMTLPLGEQAVRAVCYWEPEEFRVNTATHLFFVEAP